MTHEQLIDFFESNEDFHIHLNFYECETSIKLKDFINMIIAVKKDMERNYEH